MFSCHRLGAHLGSHCLGPVNRAETVDGCLSGDIKLIVEAVPLPACPCLSSVGQASSGFSAFPVASWVRSGGLLATFPCLSFMAELRLLLLTLVKSSRLLCQKSILQMTDLPKMAISWNDQFAKYFLPVSVLPENHLHRFTADLSDQQSLMLVKPVFHSERSGALWNAQSNFCEGTDFPLNHILLFPFPISASDGEPQV